VSRSIGRRHPGERLGRRGMPLPQPSRPMRSAPRKLPARLA